MWMKAEWADVVRRMKDAVRFEARKTPEGIVIAADGEDAALQAGKQWYVWKG